MRRLATSATAKDGLSAPVTIAQLVYQYVKRGGLNMAATEPTEKILNNSRPLHIVLVGATANNEEVKVVACVVNYIFSQTIDVCLVCVMRLYTRHGKRIKFNSMYFLLVFVTLATFSFTIYGAAVTGASLKIRVMTEALSLYARFGEGLTRADS